MKEVKTVANTVLGEAVHCTMGKLKKIAKSGQLWELISPQFFAENTYNLAQCCVYSPRISEIFCFEKTEEEGGEKGKKHVAHVC